MFLGVRDKSWDLITPPIPRGGSYTSELYAHNGLWQIGPSSYDQYSSNCIYLWVKYVDDIHATLEAATNSWFNITVSLSENRMFVFSQNTWTSPQSIAIRKIL